MALDNKGTQAARYPLPAGHAELLAWVRWAYAAMSALAAVGFLSAVPWGDPDQRYLWANAVGVVVFPALSFVSFRQLRRHHAALRERAPGRPPAADQRRPDDEDLRCARGTARPATPRRAEPSRRRAERVKQTAAGGT